MCLAFDILPEAEEDIVSCGDYLAERNLSAAWRFADAIDETIQMLCKNPEFGEQLQADPTGTIRYRTIVKYRSYLIFYRRVDSVLEVVRIIHGARDYERLFE